MKRVLRRAVRESENIGRNSGHQQGAAVNKKQSITTEKICQNGCIFGLRQVQVCH